LLLDWSCGSFGVQAVDQRSPVGDRLAFVRWILGHCTIRFGLLELAAPASGASGVHRTLTRGVASDAFVPGAVRDERNAGRNSGHSLALSMFASSEKRGASRLPVCLAWSSTWRDDPDKGDRYFAAANRDCCPRRQAPRRAGTDHNHNAQPRTAGCDLFRCLRLALCPHLDDVWYAVGWQLGCDQRVLMVAGAGLSHCT